MKSRLASCAVTLIVVLAPALAGCQQAGVPGGQPDPMVATSAPTGSYEVAPVTRASPQNRVGLPWSLIGISSDQSRLYISYGMGDGCGEYAGQVYVEETSEYVAIASIPLATSPLPTTGNACATVLKTREGYVELARPLGGRQLIHYPLG